MHIAIIFVFVCLFVWRFMSIAVIFAFVHLFNIFMLFILFILFISFYSFCACEITRITSFSILLMLEQIRKKLVKMSGFLDFEYIDDRNIRGFCLYKDGLHLLEEGKKFLANDFLSCLNRYFLGIHIQTHYPPHL